MRRKRVLVVDDDRLNREVLAALLEELGHEIEIAADGVEALAKLTLDIDLILLDVGLPGMDGYEVARQIRLDPDVGDLPIIMVTGLTSKEDRLRAVEAGANDFIAKPIDVAELRVRSASLLRMREAQEALKQHKRELEETVERRTAALRRAVEEMAVAQRRTYEAHLDAIQRLALAAECKDRETWAHIHRIGRYCALLARNLNLPPSEVETIRIASPMHDVGKIGIPDGILLKPARLTVEEREVIKQHTAIGARILGGSSSALLQAGEVIAISHHEKWDGSGYPSGLSGKEIPMYGRICAVADVYDALISERPYKNALSNEKALEIMAEGRAKHFDPRILDVFTDRIEEVVAIRWEVAEGWGPDRHFVGDAGTPQNPGLDNNRRGLGAPSPAVEATPIT